MFPLRQFRTRNSRRLISHGIEDVRLGMIISALKRGLLKRRAVALDALKHRRHTDPDLGPQNISDVGGDLNAGARAGLL